MPSRLHLRIRRSCARSERVEVRLFFRKAREFYNTASREGEELYDIAFDLTHEFRKIYPIIIKENPRITKILRYLLVPAISQMKLGQMVGISSTASIENGSPLDASLANKLGAVLRPNLDRSRFVWQQTRMNSPQRELAKRYAKKWTVSLMANQNATTDFRNWRRDLQENKVERAIMDASYRLLPQRPVIRNIQTLPPGTFVKESKVGRRSPQKADFIIRFKDGRRIVALEAKAIGVKIDAYKRVKEVRDKAAAWHRIFGNAVQTVAVIAGFIPVDQVQTLVNSQIPFFWEHDLKPLTRYLQRP